MADRSSMEWFTTECEVTIKMKATKHFLPEFIAMLKMMESNGAVGHSSWVACYADGDGAFRPKFEILTDQDILDEAEKVQPFRDEIKADCFDAG